MNDTIVLVYPHFKTEDSINQKLFNPLGIALLSAQMKLKGISAVKIDCTFKKFEKVIEEIVNINPKIIGFYTMITLSKNIYDILNQLKIHLPSALYICGGPFATLFPSVFSKHFDVIFKGEVNDDLNNFIQCYFQYNNDKNSFIKSIDLSIYPGIYVNKNGFFNENESIHLSEEQFSALPLPDREGFDHENYQKFWQEREGFKATNIITTAGCPFNCDFCSKPIFGNYFKKRAINDIIREIENIKTLGYNYLWISDDCFTLNLNFLEEFCDKLIEKKLEMKWCCLSRADISNLELFKKMKKAGCDKVYLGLESGNNNILKLMKKNLTIEQGIIAVKMLKRAKIKIAGFFIVGYPGETWETIEDTFNFALKLDLDEVSFNVPYPLPGSQLFERIPGFDPDKDWTLENETKFVYKSEFDENLIKQKITNFYKEYKKLIKRKN